MNNKQRQAEIKRLEKELAEKKAKLAEKTSRIRSMLLGRFLFDKEKGYVEPSRRGRKRGEKIGFPKTKYVAALYMLYDFPDKDRAEHAGVSYSLLLKWKTERAFQKLVTSLAYEYATAFVRRIEERAAENQKMLDKFLKETPTDKLLATEAPQLSYSEFADVHQYSPVTVSAIVENMSLLKDNFSARVEAAVILNRIPEFSSPVIEILRLNSYSEIINDVIGVLRGKEIPEQGKKCLIYTLSLMSKSSKNEANKLLKESERLFDKKLKGVANGPHIFEKSISEAQEHASVPA